MVERVCAGCGAGNELEAETCAECGQSLTNPLVQRPRSALSERWAQVPTKWQHAAKVAALGLAAVALEVGAALVREQGRSSSTALARTKEPPQPKAVRRRVWRTYRNGELTFETLEETQWFD